MHSTTCLNCNTELNGKFCHECGQKTSTHRITPQNFVMHDIVHGVFHIDKGIFFTLKQTITRPGYAALDYVEGKRKNYYNVFYLMILILGFFLIANGHEAAVKEAGKSFTDVPEAMRTMLRFLVVYTKYLILLVIPLFAFSAFMLFQRLNYNYAEHIIISGFATLGGFILLLVATALGYISLDLKYAVMFFGPVLFTGWVYYQATKKHYIFFGYIIRMVTFYFLSIIALFIVASIVAGMYLTT